MLNNFVTSQPFVIFFLVWPFIYITLLFLFVGKASKFGVRPLIMNILRTTLAYTILHLMFAIFTLILGKDFYHDLFFHQNAPIVWAVIAVSFLINIYIDFRAKHGIYRHLIVFVLCLACGAIYLYALIPVFTFLAQYISNLIADLTSIRP